jgi:hypothetical protein
VTLNPVHKDDARFHRFRRQVTTIPPTIAVAGRVFFDRASRLDFRHPMVSEEKEATDETPISTDENPANKR